MNSNLRSLSRSFMNGIKSAESGATALSTDKNVLYIMLIISVVNVLGYLMMGNFEAVVFFVIVAYLSTFFTKNMVIVFLISILATNFLMATNFRNKKEGMQNNDKKETPPPAGTPTPTPTKATPTPTTSSDPKPTNQASKKTSGEKKKEGMNGKLAPAKFNDADADDDEGDATPFSNTPAQQAKNVERAHDNLQNMGGMGVSAEQTEQVMQQQKILMDNMKTMQPFLETAERFLDKFNMKGIDGLLGKIGSSPTTAATAASN
jgi:hypothetical protein